MLRELHGFGHNARCGFTQGLPDFVALAFEDMRRLAMIIV
jgi:hypothetical protein